MAVGVYCIRNLTTGKLYVGGAYRSFEFRKKTHEEGLNRGDHFNKHLQRAWNKYGAADFVFEVLEECGEGEVQETEQWWLDWLWKQGREARYNVANIANPIQYVIEYARSPEGRKKSRKMMLANHAREGFSETLAKKGQAGLKRKLLREGGITPAMRKARKENGRRAISDYHAQRKARYQETGQRYTTDEEAARTAARNIKVNLSFWSKHKNTPLGQLRRLRMAFGRYGAGRTLEEYVRDTRPDLLPLVLTDTSQE